MQGLITDRLYKNYDCAGGEPFLRLLSPGRQEETYTYRDVIDRAWQWHKVYAKAAITPGESIAIVLQHSLDLYSAFLGALLHGAVPTMLAFPSHKFSEREYFDTINQLLANADARLVVTYDVLAERLAAVVAAESGRLRLYTAAALADGTGLSHAGRRATAATRQPDDVAFLQYSSGTTGAKKGVAISHRALLWQIDHYARRLNISSGDSIVSWLPLYHDMGLIACLFLPFLEAIPLVAMSPFDWARQPSLWTTAVTRYRATLSWLPNFAYNHMVRSIGDDELGGCDLSSLRGVVNCAEPVLADSHTRFLDRFGRHGLAPSALAASYAMAENTFAVTSGGFGEPLAELTIDRHHFARTGAAIPVTPGTPHAVTVVSSGRPLPDTRIEIVNDGRRCSEREVGEIVIESPCLLTAYHGNPDATAASLRHGRLCTGDLGFLAEGHLYVTGRKKDLVIVGGVNIYPQDVEALVNAIPGVVPGRCAAFGVHRDDMGTEMLVVLAEVRDSDERQRAAIRKAIHQALTARLGVVPGIIRVVDHMTLRKSTSGKISRSINKDRFLKDMAA